MNNGRPELVEPEYVRSGARLALPSLDERVPPQNVELEMCVLGAIMTEPDPGYTVAAEILKPADFYLDGHSKIYELMGILHGRGIPPDARSVLDELHARQLLDSIGGSGVLMGMLNAVPSAASLEQHARKVAEKSRLRRLMHELRVGIDACYDQELESGEIAARLGSALTQIASVGRGGQAAQTIGQLLDIRLPQIEERINEADAARAAGKKLMVPRGAVASGIAALDRLTGGFQFSELWYIGAATSMGKTGLALSMMYDIARYQGTPCGFLSLEMTPERLADRMLAISSASASMSAAADWITTRALRSGDVNATQRRSLTHSVASLRHARLAVDYGAGLSIGEACARLRRLHQQHGCRVLVLDHLHELVGDPRRDNRAQEIADWGRAFKSLATDLNVLVLVLAQLSRPGDKARSQRPDLTRLRDSGAIEQSGDGVLLLYRDNYYEQKPMPLGHGETTEIIVAKNRDGQRGTVEASFLAPVAMFTNKAEAGR